ncbi:HIT family protein [bacterium]|nr:MAG: HIT family protein [bacterium]
MFALDDKLKQGSAEVASLDLCLVLLMNDKTWPWLILVPRVKNAREIRELSKPDRTLLMEEIVIASNVIERLYKPDKINIGALGNVVPQLHVHVIGRFKSDKAWPGPVWGALPPVPYAAHELQDAIKDLKNAFASGRG